MGSLESRISSLEGRVRALMSRELRTESVRPCGTYGAVSLQTPLTSTDWDGDAKSTAAKTKIDLSAVFSAPAGIKAALFRVICRDSASAASTASLGVLLSPNDTANSGPLHCRIDGLPNDVYGEEDSIVPCDANGDIYYQLTASGAGTLDVYLQIWGYFL